MNDQREYLMESSNASYQHTLNSCVYRISNNEAKWDVLSSPNISSNAKGSSAIDPLDNNSLAQIYLNQCIDKKEHFSHPPYKILRNHRRSLVFRNKNVVFKRPRHKNNSKWIRFTTLFRDSEVVKEFKSLNLLNNLGFVTPKPLMAFEKKKKHMVVESWLTYEFLEGAPISLDEIPDALKLLNRLHDLGYRHDDPHIDNFLSNPEKTEDKIFLLDCRPRKNWLKNIGLGKVAMAHNYILMALRSEKKSPGSYDIVMANIPNHIRHSFHYYIAYGLFSLQKSRRWLRKTFAPRKN